MNRIWLLVVLAAAAVAYFFFHKKDIKPDVEHAVEAVVHEATEADKEEAAGSVDAAISEIKEEKPATDHNATTPAAHATAEHATVEHPDPAAPAKAE